MAQDPFLQRLIDLAAKCEVIDFSAERKAFQEGSGIEPTLQARDLRRLLLGRPDPDDGFDPSQCYRWEIWGATISGRLDLRDARLPSGSPLAALEFRDCSFVQGICADGAHLERLHLTKCRLGNSPDGTRAELSLQSARVENEVRLNGLAPIEPGGLLRVDANALKTGANFVLKRSSLRAPVDPPEEDVMRIWYALNLRNAEIGADLLLHPDLNLHGGMIAVGARIGGDLRAIGLIADDNLTAQYREDRRRRNAVVRAPLRLSGANIDGNIFLYTSSPDRRSSYQGTVDLVGVHVGRDLVVSGVSFDAASKRGEAAEALSLSLATIKGGVHFNPSSGMAATPPDKDSPSADSETVTTVQCKIEGVLNLSGSSIGGYLTIIGEVPHISATGLLVAAGLQISTHLPPHPAKSFDSSTGDSAYGFADFSNATIGGDVNSQVSYDYKTWKPVWKRDQPPSGLLLDGAKVNGTLQANGHYNFIGGTNLKVQGDARLDAHVMYGVGFGKAQIEGDCDLSALRFYSWNLEPGSTVSPYLYLRDADVKRTLRLSRRVNQRLKSELEETSGITDIKFVKAMEYQPRCYPELRIVEIEAERRAKSISGKEHFWVPFIIAPKRMAQVLTRSDVLHSLNQKHYLHLVSDEDYRDYLRLFCAYVWGEEGAFAIVEPTSTGEQPYEEKDVAEGNLPELKTIEILRSSTEDPKDATAFVRYDCRIFAATFRIYKSGMVEMGEDHELCRLKKEVCPAYDIQWKARTGVEKPDYRSVETNQESSKPKDPPPNDLKWLEKTIPDWKAQIFQIQVDLANATVDLIDATCGTLEDSNGTAWGPKIKLFLENFTYTRIATDQDSGYRRASLRWRAITWPAQKIWIARLWTRFQLRRFAIFLRRPVRTWFQMPPENLPNKVADFDPNGLRWFSNLRESRLPQTGIRERLQWLEQRAPLPQETNICSVQIASFSRSMVVGSALEPSATSPSRTLHSAALYSTGPGAARAGKRCRIKNRGGTAASN